MVKVGDKIRIIDMKDEPQYTGREGIVTFIDDIGQIHLDSCGCAIVAGDAYEILEEAKNER